MAGQRLLGAPAHGFAIDQSVTRYPPPLPCGSIGNAPINRSCAGSTNPDRAFAALMSATLTGRMLVTSPAGKRSDKADFIAAGNAAGPSQSGLLYRSAMNE